MALDRSPFQDQLLLEKTAGRGQSLARSRVLPAASLALAEAVLSAAVTAPAAGRTAAVRELSTAQPREAVAVVTAPSCGSRKNVEGT